MANYSKAAILLSVAALLFSLAVIQVAESRVLPLPTTSNGGVTAAYVICGQTVNCIHEHGKGAPPILICSEVYGAVAGDTCFSIAKTFNLTTAAFNVINPNLDCDKIFVSEWICVEGLQF